jgi:adenylyltransferase/sulfurtransferase
VDLSNLQRQIIHRHDTIGQPKVHSARRTLEALNPNCTIRPVKGRLEEAALKEAVEQATVVVDCSDNFATRFAINRACVETGTPLVSGSAIRWEGQVAVFNDHPEAPCYHCLYGDSGELDASCAANGVLAPVVGIIGSIQATETIKLITGAGEPLSGRLLLLDALSMELRSLKLKPDPGCPVCAR